MELNLIGPSVCRFDVQPTFSLCTTENGKSNEIYLFVSLKSPVSISLSLCVCLCTFSDVYPLLTHLPHFCPSLQSFSVALWLYFLDVRTHILCRAQFILCFESQVTLSSHMCDVLFLHWTKTSLLAKSQNKSIFTQTQVMAYILEAWYKDVMHRINHHQTTWLLGCLYEMTENIIW